MYQRTPICTQVCQDSSSSDSDLSDDSNYKQRRHRKKEKNRKHKKTGTYQIMREVNGKITDSSV